MEMEALQSDVTEAAFAPSLIRVRYSENKTRNYTCRDLAGMAAALADRIAEGGTEDEIAALQSDQATLAALTEEVTHVALSDEIARRDAEIARLQAERDELASRLD